MNVLIFSEQRDASTNDVIDYLKFMNHRVLRVNREDSISEVILDINDDTIATSFTVRGRKVNLDEIDSVWFRRGEFIFDRTMNFPEDIDIRIKNAVVQNLHLEELNTLENYINDCLYDKNCIGNASRRTYNKLIALKTAKEVGLKLPNSRITTKKEELKSFFEKHDKDCISKGVQDILSFTVGNLGYYYATSQVLEEDIEDMSDSFFPSLLQKNIAKKYELRIFYLRGKFYSMAIFSQLDEQTKIDFRNYNNERPNRNVPFNLPQEIEDKLEAFMQKKNLDCGSIDIIVTTENEYIFLEVNPKGQYGMVSFPCGYDLHHKIAEELINQISTQ